MGRTIGFRLVLLLILAAGVRLAALQVLGDAHVPWNYEHEVIADNLLTRGQYAYSFYNLAPTRPTSFIPPVYPLFLALVRSYLGNIEGAYKYFQIVLSSLTVLSMYALSRELGVSYSQSMLASLIMAVYPPLAAYSVDSSTVTFETFFVITGLWLAFRAVKSDSALSTLGAGACIALAALTRSTWLVLVPIILVWSVWSLINRGKHFAKFAVCMVLAVVIVMTPWILHNYNAQGQFLLTSTNGGLNFWIGNNPQATGEYIFPTQIDRELVTRVADWPEVERDRFFYARGLEFAQTAPSVFFANFGKKLFYYLFFRPNIGSNYTGAQIPIFELAKLGFVASWTLMLPFAVFGLFKTGQYWREHFLLLVVLITQAIISALYFTGTRFRTPLDGFAMIWASLGICFIIAKIQAYFFDRSLRR